MVVQRRRTKKHTNQSSSSKSKKKENKNTLGDDEQKTKIPEQEPLYVTFMYHPIVIITAFITIPYGIYVSYFYLLLQRPDILSTLSLNTVNLRPAVGVNDERQLLIVGSMSTGTSQVTIELNNKLGIEMAHESSDSQWNYARDGTVSWFHGIRFMDPPKSKQDKLQAIADICISSFDDSNGSHPANMGFHPGMYRPPTHGCSYRKRWDSCWSHECAAIMSREWGCAKRKDCEINFRRNVHQVRHPLRTIESLYVKFCHTDVENIHIHKNHTFSNGNVNPSFLLFANSIFRSQHDFTHDSCLDAVSYYVVLYNNALLQARKRGEIANFYHVEESTPCDVAEVAGLLSPNTTVYQPNYDRIAERCKVGSRHYAATHKFSKNANQINKNNFRIEWGDFNVASSSKSGKRNTKKIETMVKELVQALGYEL